MKNKLFKTGIVLICGLTLGMELIPTVVVFAEDTHVQTKENINNISEINQKYSPTITFKSNEQLDLIYKVSKEDLKTIEESFSINGNARNRAYTTTNYGSFKKSSATGIAGAIIGICGFGSIGGVISIASILYGDSKNNTIYYSYTQTSWRASDGFHVRGSFKFYRNAKRTSYITGFTMNRVYTD